MLVVYFNLHSHHTVLPIFTKLNCYFIKAEKYDSLVNGEAQEEIEEYMRGDHTFEEYCEVT